MYRLSQKGMVKDVKNKWHRAYHGTVPDSISSIMKVGKIVPAGKTIPQYVEVI